MRRRWLCIPALSWCGFLALFHGGAAGLACSFDTSYYALTRAKNGIYTGAMTPNTAFTVYFESRRGPVGGFSSDARGRYCVIWAQERIIPAIYAGRRYIGGIHHWRPLNGARPPRDCQAGDRGIPWRRADDLKTSWQFRSLAALLVATAAVLLLGLGARRLRAAGLAMTLASTLFTAALWFL